jgi:hypothetical protein
MLCLYQGLRAGNNKQRKKKGKQEQGIPLTAAKKGEEAGKSFYGPTTKRRRSKSTWGVDEKANVVMSWQN